MDRILRKRRVSAAVLAYHLELGGPRSRSSAAQITMNTILHKYTELFLLVGTPRETHSFTDGPQRRKLLLLQSHATLL